MEVSRLAHGTPVKYYPNSVDASSSRTATVGVPEIPGLGHGFSVVFAGNVGTAEAVEVSIEAATLLKEQGNIQFVVAGDGSRRDWMFQEADQRGLTNLHLPGRLPVEMMPGIMQKASALLVTLADESIFAATVPNKVQAYMGAGRPILACMRGEGARLVTAAKPGLAVPVEDGFALAEAVFHLRAMPEAERDALGNNGRAYFQEHFDHDRLVDQLIESLRQLTRKGGKAK